MSTRKVVFRAHCVVNKHTSPDDVLAEALSVIGEHHPVVRSRAHRMVKVQDTIWIGIEFWAANDSEAVLTAQRTESALLHRWPTDSATLDGRSFKNHRPTKEA